MKKFILGTIVGIMLCGGIVYGLNVYESNSIKYSPTDAGWEVSNVNDAINSLYSMKTELDNIKSVGDAVASDILEGKTALVQGELITGNATAKDRDWRLVVEFTTYLTSNGYSTSSPWGTRIYTLTLEHINGNTTLKEAHSGYAHINGELYGTPTAFCEGFKIVSFTYLD